MNAATKYQLQERLGSGSWATIHDAVGTSKDIEGQANGSWGYRARGCNVAGCGPYSAIKTVSVQLLTPAVPTGLTVTSQGMLCKFSWNSVGGTTSYKLGNGNVTFYEGPCPVYQWDAPCGTAGYRVAACNANGCSAWSGPVFGSGGGGGTPLQATPALDEEGGE
ncbi:hypothetical protein [Luteimonas salinilitoris]|uniref:Fibronectin type-III domain-containing protein n=1 Tax=Luteimonas salinilitoris TaxID=3237697 RepID=A0ABV4HP04_9GAMM